ncbi:MAG: hypothetical protein A2469_03435 [Candidatus Magasanikbacteria bacterium RIFOXYC2_FULL_40_16]|uniref:Carbohydrate kinase PfkB domain-containing protein n=1 Tax=Candidatus Magasanikbacteria bacterium RIFOXYC2_FULL_40_16 TaxID=1798703 RepID=A0A1F6P2G3_9BACT|nr:MAG: hypothetical protein A2469_03435 [Candidatus Magasanikbacteria bacterium RIFOXYC2_FULL_40_16]
MYDIITIGDVTTDILLDMDEKSNLCRVDKKTQELKLKFTGKIPVAGIHRVIGGGNASNHAIGASRLGLKTAIYTIGGRDDAGDAFRHKIKREGVSDKYVYHDTNNGTNLSTIINYNEERTVLSYHAKRTYQMPKFDKTKWIYFSSIHGNQEEFNEQLFDYVKNNSVKLAFNPGSRQLELGADALKKIFAVSEIVFVNRQEVEALVGKASNIKKLANNFFKLGMKMAVITEGKKGSYCYNGKNFYKIGIIKTKAVESTGCGDAYASGFLSAFISKKTVAESMRWGAVNAASVLSKIGSQAGLLTRQKMGSILEANDFFQARVS